LPTFYLRRAQAYRFVRGVLEQTFGVEALRQMHRQTAEGPVAPDLAAELAQMQALFFGAYATTCRQLGMTPQDDRVPGPPPSPRSGSGPGTSAATPTSPATPG
jgi:hypothetical protein